MPKVTQLTVPCDNRPGALADIADVLGGAKVNIVGFQLFTSKGKSYVGMIVDDVERAEEALDEAALDYFEKVVLHARIMNVPGALGRFVRKLAAKDINITSGFQTIEEDSEKASLVLDVSNLEHALLTASKMTPSDRL